jgi:hypothetical protein
MGFQPFYFTPVKIEGTIQYSCLTWTKQPHKSISLAHVLFEELDVSFKQLLNEFPKLSIVGNHLFYFGQVTDVYQDIDSKKKAARYLHAQAVMVENGNEPDPAEAAEKEQKRQGALKSNLYK